MRIGIVLVISLLLSSCGLFKKVSRTKASEEVTIVADSVRKIKIIDAKSTYETTNDNTNVTTQIEADQVTILPNGSIDAKGNVKVSQNALKQARSDKAEVINTTATEESSVKNVFRHNTKEDERTSTPDDGITSRVGNVIAIILLSVAVIVYLLVRKKLKK